MLGVLTLLSWRVKAALAMPRQRPLPTLGNAAVFGSCLWLAALFTEVGRRTPGLQVVLAMAGGVGVALWSSTSRVLKEVRRHAAAREPLVTERLALRAPRATDGPAYANSLDAQMMAANGWTEALRRSAIIHMNHVDRLPMPAMTVIADRVTDEPVGWISVSGIDRADGSCELGWSMAPHARGKGYGTEAIRAALASLHGNGFRRITIGTNEDNGPARRVLERVGAVQVRTGPHTLPNGESVSSVWYADEGPVAESRPQACA
jgi:RimJ/RimL family protein N-acetyltransferase